LGEARKMPGHKISEATVQRFEVLEPLLDSMHKELSELAKKKQDGALSKTRIDLVNRLLGQVRDLLKKEETAQFLDLLDEASMPQNADAVVTLGQYRAAMKHFEKKYSRLEYGERAWSTPNKSDGG
jgi:hypothetical protein